MCRYSEGLYLPKMVCFACRRSFKEIAVCPECGRELVSLGRDFQAPRRSNKRAWKVVQRLYENGVRFDSCGCSGPGFRPTILREVEPFLKSRREIDEAIRLIEGLQGGRRKAGKKIRPDYPDRSFRSHRIVKAIQVNEEGMREYRREMANKRKELAAG
jgi:hypothetical protein